MERFTHGRLGFGLSGGNTLMKWLQNTTKTSDEDSWPSSTYVFARFFFPFMHYFVIERYVIRMDLWWLHILILTADNIIHIYYSLNLPGNY